MKKLTQEQLNEVVRLHRLWLLDRPKGVRADLSGTDLSRVNLSGVDLYGANLSKADLSGANLSGANLSEANLFMTNLYEADLSGAILCYANLSGADLTEANLTGANLYRANLSKAILSEANLYEVNLPSTSIVPEEGSFIGWKKYKDQLIKLLILEDSKRLNSIGSRKCRASKVKVLEISEPVYKECYVYDRDFKYEINKIIEVTDFNDDIREECASGIHFFITKQEAIDW